MPTTLPKPQRKLLEKVTQDARDIAESAARAAIENLAVHEKDYRGHMTVEQRQLRNRLRSRGRALGDPRNERSGTQAIGHLAEDIAYEQWHRLLFTRFLTENNLLHTDSENGSVPVTLDECEELAPEMGARDGFDLACRFAAQTLPGVFRRNDPVLDLRLAQNDEVELRKLLHSLPSEVFTADDSLGWTYQFWQAKRKDEVNASGKKIGAAELAPVTQLFTEDYMVEFLLHNTIGAWWAGKLGPIQAATEEEARVRTGLLARDGVPAIPWTYLRFIQDEVAKSWLPAAGIFPDWPTATRLIRLLDPCMGSGHFLVFALPILVRLRVEEEKLSASLAVVAVLRDNLHGLELDERCTQIAAFNVALAAWKLAGYQMLPPLHLACSGLAPSAGEAEWVSIAGVAGENSDRLQRGMVRLHDLFKDAPTLGSLVNPRALAGDLIEAEFHEMAPLLTVAIESRESQKAKVENDAVELAVIAQGLAKAAELLAGQFTLVITNVPYLGRGKQVDLLKEYCVRLHKDAKADLATCFVERCLKFCTPGGSAALVTPQSFLFQGSYKHLRRRLLRTATWDTVARLGPHAFETIGGEVVSVTLLTLTQRFPSADQILAGIDASAPSEPGEKAFALSAMPVVRVSQASQLENPEWRIVIDKLADLPLLNKYLHPYAGINCGDSPRFLVKFWELEQIQKGWVLQQTAGLGDSLVDGLDMAFLWEEGKGQFFAFVESLAGRLGGSWRRGEEAWGRRGVAVSRMSDLHAHLYMGSLFDQSVSVLMPQKEEHLLPVLCYCLQGDFRINVRKNNPALAVSTAVLAEVPFDLAHWQKVAVDKYPDGLPKPHTNDPTQWLFNGHPKGSTQPLHVALARLVGYRWPRQTGSSFPDCPALRPDGLESHADEDGIVCLSPLNREQPAAARLRQILSASLGDFDEHALIASAGLKGSKSKSLEDWLRDECFEQHAKMFHDRPFLWHLWDGRPDGFHAFVNYHRLDDAMLQKLTYSYLGDWIRQQDEDARNDIPGAADRLGAARILQNKLAKILEGEPPYDIFVRWKPIFKQPGGWHPDLNDGVRLNIRPFMLAKESDRNGAGLLRAKPNIKWDKDRGMEPVREKTDFPWFWCDEEPTLDPTGDSNFKGHRWNNVHLSLDRKRRALGKIASEKA